LGKAVSGINNKLRRYVINYIRTAWSPNMNPILLTNRIQMHLNT